MPNWPFFMQAGLYALCKISIHIDLVFKQCRIVFATKQRNLRWCNLEYSKDDRSLVKNQLS